MRLRALIRKEFLQIARDPSSIAIAFVMPLFLLLLFGYGVSLDAERVPLAFVAEVPTADTRDFAASLAGSPYFALRPMLSLPEAERAMQKGEVDAIVRLRADFSERPRRPDGAPIQAIVNGVDANTARLTLGYLEGAWGNWLARRAADESVAGNRAGDAAVRYAAAYLDKTDYAADGVVACNRRVFQGEVVHRAAGADDAE